MNPVVWQVSQVNMSHFSFHTVHLYSVRMNESFGMKPPKAERGNHGR